MNRQQVTRDTWGRALRANMTIPEGILAIIDQISAERIAANGWEPTTRSGIASELIAMGIKALNDDRDEPLVWEAPLQ